MPSLYRRQAELPDRLHDRWRDLRLPDRLAALQRSPKADVLAHGPGGQPVEQPLSFYGPAGFLGQEQANIRIHPQTTAGEYRLSVGFSFQNSTFRNNQRLLVRLGPATTG